MLIPLLLVLAATAAQPAGNDLELVLRGTIIERETGEGIGSADVLVLPSNDRAQTDREGRFEVRGVRPGLVTLRVTRLGYDPADTTLHVHRDTTVVLRLERRPVAVEGLTAGVIRPRFARQGRELFEAEIQTGLVAVDRAEMEEMPLLGAADVLRSRCDTIMG